MIVDRINKIMLGRVFRAKPQRAGNLPALPLTTSVSKSQQYSFAKGK